VEWNPACEIVDLKGGNVFEWLGRGGLLDEGFAGLCGVTPSYSTKLWMSMV
jgi:hypothetical protein